MSNIRDNIDKIHELLLNVKEESLCQSCTDHCAFECEVNYLTFRLREFFQNKDNDDCQKAFIALQNMRCKCALEYLILYVAPLYNDYDTFVDEKYKQAANLILDYFAK